MSKSTRTPITAAVVRARVLANPKAAEVLSEAALRTVQPGARGRLHPEVIAFDSKGRRKEQRYVSGATKAVVAARKAEAAQARAALAASGVPVGKRGPLPKVAAPSSK